MTEKESKKVKKRTGKLLSSFVVLTIVISVLAASVTSVSAEDFNDIIVTADPSVILADGASTSTITATLIKDGIPVAKQGQVVIFDFVDDSLDASLYPIGDTTDENGKANTTLTAGTKTGVVIIEATVQITAGMVTNTTQVTLSGAPEVESIVVSPSEKALIVGGTQQFNATAYDQYGNVTPDVEFTWESSNETVGTVNETTGFFEASALGHTLVNATNASIVGSASVTVTEYAPDLIVTEIKPNCSEIFGNESNEICAVIKNIGPEAADAFNVSFVIDGFSEKERVSGLAAGANTTRCVNDSTSRNAGDSVTITVTADCDGEVEELDETNNASSIEKNVVNNGYKGKTYTGGENITTSQTHTLNGSVLYSVGDSYYLSASAYPNWTTYNVSWNISDLLVPANASVEKARLYVPYTWDKKGIIPDNVNMSFNGVIQILDAHYSDEKGWATSYPYGMLAYNVTADFNKTSGNVANLINLYPGGNNVSIRGMLLVVIYADNSELQRTIIVNEGFDLLYGGSAHCTTPEEATAYAPFADTIEDIANKSARLITVAPGAGPNEGELIFNGNVWNDVWNFAGDTEIGIDDRDVTAYLDTTNEAGFQSSADYMEASNAILVVEYKVGYTVSVPLLGGWNMVGVPLNVSNWTLPNVLGSIGGKYDYVCYYNATTGEMDYYDPLDPGDSTLKTLEPGAGYLISMTEDAIVSFEGTKLIGLERSLETDWNMFSVPYGVVNETLPTVLESIEGKYDYVCYYNATTGEMDYYDPLDPGDSTLKTLEPGAGYLISVTEPAIFIPDIE